MAVTVFPDEIYAAPKSWAESAYPKLIYYNKAANSALGSKKMGIWTRTVDKTGEGWVQADRGGRPLQAVFLPGEKREEYLQRGASG